MTKNKKSAAVLACVLLCIIAACSCSADNPADTGPNSEAVITTAQGDLTGSPDTSLPPAVNEDPATEPEPLSMEKDLGIRINGQWFPIWQDSTDLLQALGDEYVLSAAPSCVFEGEDKEFSFDGVSIFTNPDGNKDIWYSIYLDNDLYSTSRDIHVGCSLEEILAAYGDRYYWEGESLLTYSISGVEGDIASPCLLFTLEEDRVAAIEIYFPTNVS